MDKLKRLQARLDYQFSDPDLLTLALSHRSVGRYNNERLEFLGDSILNHVIAEALYQRFDEVREGELSRLRASLVKGETLADSVQVIGSYVDAFIMRHPQEGAARLASEFSGGGLGSVHSRVSASSPQ